MSITRKIYFLRLIGRILVLLAAIFLFVYRPEEFSIVEGMNFFRRFSPLHILWGIWAVDMILQLMPVKAYISIGSQKQFLKLFRPSENGYDCGKLKEYIKSSSIRAYTVFVVWLILTGILGILYGKGIINDGMMVLVSTFFYVCDLICVLIWCPFRLIMKNRCCTTCRIFNWDHLMMFSPFVFVGGFFGMTLFFAALAIWLVWELCVLLHPERFWEMSNISLKCSKCSDKLCTQYCKKCGSR